MLPRLSTFMLIAAIVIGSAGVPAAAQQVQDRATTATSASPSGSNPTRDSVNEQQLLRELRQLEGRITIPDTKAALLEQPQGRSYQFFHEQALPWIMGVLIIAMVLALASFYAVHGRVETGRAEAGIRIKRFNVLERLTHWTTATSFIVLAITGLNYVFGKRLLFPLTGPDAFATWSQWSKLAHTAIAWPFMVGLLAMLALWVRDNLPDRYDARWVRELGGFTSGTHPPAARFNAGQKAIFWAVVIFGLVLSASGIVMLFPFWGLDVTGMQWAQYLHASAAAILIAVIIAHIYVGTLGMRGAYDAMGKGDVDLAWAQTHHSAWVENQQQRDARPGQRTAPGVPAE